MMMRTRATRSTMDRGYTHRPTYTRREESDTRATHYNSSGRYREFDHGSNRDNKDNFNSSRDYNYRDYNSGRDYNNSRPHPSGRDYPQSSRGYPNSSRDYNHNNRDYNQNNRDFHGPRDFQSSRDHNRDYPSSRDYPPSSRDYNRYRDYNQTSRSYPPNNRDMVHYDKYHQDRRFHRERSGPYDRRNLNRPEMHRMDSQGYHDPKRSGPLRRGPQHSSKVHRTKVFIGNLSGEVTQEELTNKFAMFGPINRIDFRRKFAFVDFVRPRDADMAIREMHNKLIWGSWLKVQPHIEQQKKLSSREPKPTLQVTVTNLDHCVSWQDLKDFARQAGDVSYASIIIKGDKRFGLIEFTTDVSVQNAMRDLNGKKIVSNNLELIHVPVSEYLKKLGYHNEPVVEDGGEDTLSSHSDQHNEDQEDNERYNNDTFEAEDNSKSPSLNDLSNPDDLYQEEGLDTVDYN